MQSPGLNTGPALLEPSSVPPVVLSTPSAPLILSTLPPVYRALLTLDGTVTRFLESWLGERVEVRRLRQSTVLLPEGEARLSLGAGEWVTAREVLLIAPRSKGVLAHASSYMNSARLPVEVQEAIMVPGAGLGRVIDQLKLETYREILSMGWSTDPPEALALTPGARALRRTYRVFLAGEPVLLIQECFPVLEL